MKRRNNQKGFTLIELLVVIAIIGILAAVIAPNVFAQIERGKISAVVSEYRAVKTAAILVSSDGNLSSDDAGLNKINALLEKKMFNRTGVTDAAEAPFGGYYTIDSTGEFLLVPNVPIEAGKSIGKTIANYEPATTSGTNKDDVRWVTVSSGVMSFVDPTTETGTLAIRLVQ